jgi:hypothetical protein
MARSHRVLLVSEDGLFGRIAQQKDTVGKSHVDETQSPEGA